MDIGLAIAQVGPFADTNITRAFAIEAELQGYSSLWALDRLLAPVAPRTPYPASADGSLPPGQSNAFDPLVSLTLAAAVTERIGIGTNVLVAPWYSPVLLARSLATLDRVSNGRLTAGLGLGWSQDEYAAVGVAQRQLALRMEEILETMSRAWRDDVVEIETSREIVAPSHVDMKPTNRRVPILLAAYTPNGLERIARRADGWTPAGVPAPYVAEMWGSVLSTAVRYGRDVDAMRLVVRANVYVTDEITVADRPPFVGSIEQIRADVEAHHEIGVHELIVDMQATTDSFDQLFDLTAQITAGILTPA